MIRPEEVLDFVYNLPLKKIPGVGTVTQEKLAQLGFHTCGDIQQAEQRLIYQQFGKFGQRLWDFCHGIDSRNVETDRSRKSLAVENTLLEDICELSDAEKIVKEQYQKLLFRLQRNREDKPLSEFKKIGIKLKFDDFTQTTLERTTDGMAELHFLNLLVQGWQRRNGRKVRLIGLNVHFPEKKVTKQLNLWE